MSSLIANDTVIFEVIRRPLINEKSTAAQEQNKLTFRVRKDATKQEIKQAVEALFSTKVAAVNTIVQLGKTRRFRGVKGYRSDYKKAVVTLVEGQTVDVLGGVK